MTQEQLKAFIENRKAEKEKLMNTTEYLSFLNSEGVIDTKTYREIEIDLNNRNYFLDKSIYDHEKLIK